MVARSHACICLQLLLSPSLGAGAERWGALDDVVMGGVSESSLVRVQGAGEDGGDALVFRWADIGMLHVTNLFMHLNLIPTYDNC
jgi:hypothetical protein